MKCGCREDSRGFRSIENDRHGAGVDQLDLHARPEHAAFLVQPRPGQRCAERLVDRLGLRAGGRAGEARPVALRGVGEQRELADREARAAGVEDATGEAARLILEDAEPRDLRGAAA